jgi:AraC-like DNA-binding protein
MRRTDPQEAVCQVVNCLQAAIFAPPSERSHLLSQLRPIETVLRSPNLPFNYGFVVRQVLVVHLRRWIRQTMPEDHATFDPALHNLAESGAMTLPEAYRALLQALEAASSGAGRNPVAASQPDARVVAALSRIRESSRENIRLKLADIATGVKLSRWHLERLIKRQTGMRFTELTRQGRVGRGLDLLQSSSLSFKEIAAELGYQNPSQFNRDFRRVTGVSPTKWRSSRRRTF